MRTVLLGLAILFAGCESGGGHGHGGGFGGGGGGGFSHSESHSSSSSSSSSSSLASSHHASSGTSTAVKVGEAVTEAVVAGLLTPDDPEDPVPDPGAPARETAGPLLDNHDPCNRCPDDFECGQCTGIAGAKCTWAPSTAASRCSSPR